jgi:two-component system chemotaxis response regulator CheB
MVVGSKDVIRVLIVDDSPLIVKVLTSILNSDSNILIVGTARDGREAVEVVPRLKPDLLTMDIEMPVMDGLEATKQIMAYCPTPILVVSATIFKGGTDKVFRAISYGALDVMDKGRIDIMGDKDKKFGAELIEKIKFLSKIKVMRHPLAKLENEKRAIRLKSPFKNTADKIVAIVVSTGGPQALFEILRNMPSDFPCGIVIVQHIVSGFVEGLAEWLAGQCDIAVKVACDSEEILPAVAYLAPSDLHMTVRDDKKISLSNDLSPGNHKPSGNVLLESVAKVYQEGAVGVILTGMGQDGAQGMKAVKQKHGQTIAQDEKSCIVFGMPKVAIELGVIDKVVPLQKIAETIVEMLKF